MWALHFLPDSVLLYVVNSILLVGAVSSFLAFFVLHRILNKFPTLAPYHLLFQIVSAGLLVAGIYFKGGYSTEMAWRERVAEAEAKVAAAEIASNEANIKLDAERKKKQKVRVEYAIQIKERIIEKEKLINEGCVVSAEAVNTINLASKNPSKIRKGTVTIEDSKK